jgi:hypothetical protein
MDKEDALRVLYSVRKGDACSTTIRFATPFTLLDKRDACIILNMIDYRKKSGRLLHHGPQNEK